MAAYRAARGHHRSQSQADLEFGLQKKLVWLLRHNAQSFDIQLDPAGFASVHKILALREFPTWRHWKLADIARVVDCCGKGRLELQGAAIRAVQGHSIRSVTQAADHWEPDQDALMHGTTLDKWPCIRQEGLHRMTRNHIHLSADFGEHLRDTGVLVTNVAACLDQGLLFERSRNGVILTTGPIPPTCFLRVEWQARSFRSSSSARREPAVTLWASHQDRTHEARWEGRGAQPAAQPPTNHARLCRAPTSSELPGGTYRPTDQLNLASRRQRDRHQGDMHQVHQGDMHQVRQVQHPPSWQFCRSASRSFCRRLRGKLRHQRRKLRRRKLRHRRHQRRKLRRTRLRHQRKKMMKTSTTCQKSQQRQPTRPRSWSCPTVRRLRMRQRSAAATLALGSCPSH